MRPGPVELSVVIVTRNTRELTRAAVRSVFDSQDAWRKQVIVVDNGSTDGTLETLAREFPELTYLRSETNLGFAGANNLGARQAEGEFLLLLNSDARLKPESLALAVDWMRQHPECGIAGAQLLNPDGSRQNSIANAPSLATELLNKSLLRRLFPRRYPGKEHASAGPLAVESVVGAFMLVRTALWKELGGLDERYFFFLEETDFCVQARQRGWQVFHLPQVQVWHEQGRSAGQAGAAARVEYWRSRYLYFQKHSNRGVRLALRAGLSLRLAADWLASACCSGLTLGRSTRWRNRHHLNTTLWRWHLRGQPLEMGLPR